MSGLAVVSGLLTETHPPDRRSPESPPDDFVGNLGHQGHSPICVGAGHLPKRFPAEAQGPQSLKSTEVMPSPRTLRLCGKCSTFNTYGGEPQQRMGDLWSKTCGSSGDRPQRGIGVARSGDRLQRSVFGVKKWPRLEMGLEIRSRPIWPSSVRFVGSQ